MRDIVRGYIYGSFTVLYVRVLRILRLIILNDIGNLYFQSAKNSKAKFLHAFMSNF